ncbi:MAG: hypothetical protein AAGF71_01395 [Pseudomonadota bacterium]
MAIGQELLNVPMGDMIRDMAFAIAEAQYKLDENAVEVAEMMGGLKTIVDQEGNITFDDSRVFFGHEYMPAKAALITLAADDAYSGAIDKGEANFLKEYYEGLRDAVEKDEIGEEDEVRIPTRVSMLELGFTPTFYQFIDTIIEVKIAIKITRSSEYNYGSTRSTEDKQSAYAYSYSRKDGGIIGKIFGGSRSGSGSGSRSSSVQTSQVDAAYSSRYSYSAEGASLLRTKLSPVPPPPILEERIRAVMDQERARRERLAEAFQADAPNSAKELPTDINNNPKSEKKGIKRKSNP